MFYIPNYFLKKSKNPQDRLFNLGIVRLVKCFYFSSNSRYNIKRNSLYNTLMLLIINLLWWRGRRDSIILEGQNICFFQKVGQYLFNTVSTCVNIIFHSTWAPPPLTLPRANPCYARNYKPWNHKHHSRKSPLWRIYKYDT